MQTIQLHQQTQVPSVGFGFWKVDNDACRAVTQQAIAAGYRHLDCAADYGNEVQVGQGIADAIGSSSVTRDDLWVTSKLWNNFHRPEHVRGACEKSLTDLGLDHLDLYLIHFPIALEYVSPEVRYPPGWFDDPGAASPKMHPIDVPIAETWAAMQRLVDEGLVRHIGVCNFGVSLLRDLMATATAPPAMLQIESHPLLTQAKLVRFCHEHGIGVTAFCPLGAQSYFELSMADPSMSLLSNDVIGGIAGDVQRTPAQVLLRWGVQRGTAVIPKTSQRERMRENLALFDFELSDDQMAAIGGLNQNRRFNDPGDFCESAFNTFFPIYE